VSLLCVPSNKQVSQKSQIAKYLYLYDRGFGVVKKNLQ